MEQNFQQIIIDGNRRLTLADCQLLHKCSMEIKPKVLVEVGSMDGTSSILLGIVARENVGHLYCIEPKPKEKWWANRKKYELTSWITLIKKYSPWVTFPIFTTDPIDFLFIDGDHRTRWVLCDYHYWTAFVRKGGLIAFHDYSGAKGVGEWVRRAIDIIMEDDSDKIKEVGRAAGQDRGTIIFEKLI